MRGWDSSDIAEIEEINRKSYCKISTVSQECPRKFTGLILLLTCIHKNICSVRAEYFCFCVCSFAHCYIIGALYTVCASKHILMLT